MKCIYLTDQDNNAPSLAAPTEIKEGYGWEREAWFEQRAELDSIEALSWKCIAERRSHHHSLHRTLYESFTRFTEITTNTTSRAILELVGKLSTGTIYIRAGNGSHPCLAQVPPFCSEVWACSAESENKTRCESSYVYSPGIIIAPYCVL